MKTRTCDELGCLDPCQSLVNNYKQTQVEVNQPTSSCPGNIEAACSLAHRQMSELNCTADTNSTAMIIALTNGNFVLNDG